MNLETGKHYKATNGAVILITGEDQRNHSYPFIGVMIQGHQEMGLDAKWKGNGQCWINGDEWDLLEETDPSSPNRKTLHGPSKDSKLGSKKKKDRGRSSAPGQQEEVPA